MLKVYEHSKILRYESHQLSECQSQFTLSLPSQLRNNEPIRSNYIYSINQLYLINQETLVEVKPHSYKIEVIPNNVCTMRL